MTHSPETIRTALDASRTHWRANLAAETPREVKTGHTACALCGLFNNSRTTYAGCLGCPVMRESGKRYCRGTPYASARWALFDWIGNPTSPEAKAAWQAACLPMCEYLERLEP